MKKSLTKLLARMARDGDAETVAEFIGEMIGEENPAEAVAEVAAEAVETAVETEEPVIVEAPEAKEITIDEESVAGIIERLDQLIALLTPAAADEEMNAGAAEASAEEIAEIVEEVVEAVAAEPDAEIPAVGEEEIAELIESIVESEAGSVTLEDPVSDEDPDESEKPCVSDQLEASLMAVRPALKDMSREKRKKACADIAARLRRRSPNGADSRYAMVKAAVRNDRDLGKRIMAARNPNYRK